jgi:hypothetical protein
MASIGSTGLLATNLIDTLTTEVIYIDNAGLFGRVPPAHVALSRLFMDLDGHRIKKGLKVVTASNYPLFKHKFDVSKIMLPKCSFLFECRVRT